MYLECKVVALEAKLGQFVSKEAYEAEVAGYTKYLLALRGAQLMQSEPELADRLNAIIKLPTN
jgi:hypothetical protein